MFDWLIINDNNKQPSPQSIPPSLVPSPLKKDPNLYTEITSIPLLLPLSFE